LQHVKIPGPWICRLALGVLALLAPDALANQGQSQGKNQESAILPLAQVRPGMVGEARTVFQGTTPESFAVRVVSVLRNFLPKQDIILVRAEDARVEASGNAAGMSGSPVYVDGKLMGAIAYGWSFAKEPLAGVTPIEAMLAEGNRRDRPPDPYETVGKRASVAHDESAPRLLPVALPLSVSGASDASLAYLDEELHNLGFHSMRAGGSGSIAAGKPSRQVLPGSAVGVALMEGDMSTTAMGTLTYSDGKHVFAFGHPMFGIGAVKLPLVLGEVQAIIPSLSSSLKVASPVAEIGTLTDDGKNGVVGVLGEWASRVPVRIHVQSQGTDKAPFSVEVARHRKLLPLLATAAVSTALSEAIPDVADLVAEVTTKLSVRGFAPIELRDQIFTNEALAPRVLAMSHGMRALGDLLGNPFAPVVVDAIEVAARVEFRSGPAEIVALAASREKVRAGEELELAVTLRPYGGVEAVQTVTVGVPVALAGKTVKIEAAAGSQVKPDMPKAEDLAGFVRNLSSYYPATSLVVSLASKEDGASVRGNLIRDLPPSALDTLRPASQSLRAEGVRTVKQIPFSGTRILAGHKDITVQVLPQPKR
jgi:hypothetical protein